MEFTHQKTELSQILGKDDQYGAPNKQKPQLIGAENQYWSPELVGGGWAKWPMGVKRYKFPVIRLQRCNEQHDNCS